MKTEMPEIDELLTPLFVQARQEALKEANKIPLNRSGIVTSTPTKVAHLVKEAEIAINELTLKQVLSLIGESDVAPINDPTEAEFDAMNDKERMGYAVKKALNVGLNQYRAELRQSAERIWK